MKKLFILLLFIPSLLIGDDFEKAMGKGASVWQFIRTPEDREKVEFFKTLYEKKERLTAVAEARIPKKIHMIWLGPDPFPKGSLGYVKKWLQLHPNWELNFWTDLEMEPLFKGVNMRRVGDVSFKHLFKCFKRADNFKEKAFYLGLEILDQEGGLYIEHDVEPKVPFSDLHEKYDFFGVLAPLKPSIFSSSLYPETYLFGAAKGHPFLTGAMQHLRDHFDRYQTFFPGQSSPEIIYRTQQRLYDAFEKGIETGVAPKTGREIFFPSSEVETLVHHHHVGAWTKLETIEQKKMREKLEQLTQGADFVLAVTWGVGALVALGTALYFLRWRRG